MNHKDPEELAKELRHIEVYLPAHQEMLRAQLLKMHATRPNGSRLTPANLWSQFAELFADTKKTLSIGVVIATLGIIILGLVFMRPSDDSNSERVIAKAAQEANQVSVPKIAQAPEDYSDPDEPAKNTNRSEGSHVTPTAEAEAEKIIDEPVERERRRDAEANPNASNDTGDEIRRIIINLERKHDPPPALGLRDPSEREGPEAQNQNDNLLRLEALADRIKGKALGLKDTTDEAE